MPRNELWNMDPVNLLRFADAWVAIGDEGRHAVIDVMSGSGGISRNIVRRAQERLSGYNRSIDHALGYWMDRRNEHDD
jgi:hypothetical protein